MARIFISHSSLDNEAATRMKAWLASQGFESAFLDKDKTSGIPPGADWERTLYREVEQSQAVIIIQTPNWLASKWCFAEFTQARALGKAIFPAIEAPSGDTLISPDIQTLNLLSDREGGLERLKRELVRIALDAQGGFAWDATRPPFPGLLAFQEEDAAIYFGRGDDIRRLIERLEARRAQGGAKLIALLGSSGSGKSSLFRAGVIPRLKRAGRNWIVVPAMRPRIHPVDELARALATASNPPLDWAKLRDDLIGRDPARALDNFASDLRVKACAGEAQILIPIDQAEELFGVADPDEARRFLEILSQALSESLPFLAVMAMRSDFLGQLQSAAALTAKFEEFSLGPMPLARVPQIIEGPARVAGLSVEDAFVQRAARDAETEDALPLLAFALRELLNRSPNKSLTLAGYAALGDEKAGLTPLENAVRQAADEVLAEAKPADDELTALREAFVPAMVRVNDQGEYVRRPAGWDELPAKGRPLLERLAKARLLVLRQDGDARVVEVAHEALLRKWPLLKSWLDSARAFLIGKQQLEQDLRDWEQAAETDKAAALLTGLKLSRARRWLIEHPNQLSAQERGFIQASIERAEAETRRNERTRRNITRGSIAAALVLAIVAGVAVYQSRQAQEATARALDQLRVSLAGQWQDANPNKAAEILAEVEDPHTPIVQRKLAELLRLPLLQAELPHTTPATFVAFSPRGGKIVTLAQDNTARVWDAVSGKPVTAPLPHDQAITSAAISPDDRLLLTQSGQGVKLWDIAAGAVRHAWQYDDAVTAIGFDASGRTAAAAAGTSVWLYEVETGQPKDPAPRQLEEQIVAIAFAPVGDLVAAAPESGRVRIWNLKQGSEVEENKGPILKNIRSLSWNPPGTKLLTASCEGVNVWDVATRDGWSGEPSICAEEAWWNADGTEFLTRGREGTLLWYEVGPTYSNSTLTHDNDERLLTAAFREGGSGPVTLTGTGYSTGYGTAFSVNGLPPSPTRLRLWGPGEIKPGKIVALPHNGELVDAAFNPGGTLVATLWGERQGGAGHAAHLAPSNVVEVWNVQISGERFSRLLPGTAPVLMPNDVVATASGEDVRFWDLASGHERPTGPLHHDRPVRSVAISADGTKAATATDQAIHIWEMGSGDRSRAVAAHPMDQAGNLSFDPTGRLLRSMGYPRMSIWDVASWDKELPDAPADCYADPILMDVGWRLVQQTCGDRAYAWVWDGSRFIGPRSRPHSGHVFNSAVSPDGHLVATASASGLEIWDPARDAPPRAFSLGAPADRIAFSPDNQTVAVVDSGERLHVIDLASDNMRSLKVDWRGRFKNMAFAGLGGHVITEEESDHTLLQVRQASDGQPSARIQLDRDRGDVAWSLVDNGDVALVLSGNRAGLWSVDSGEPLFVEPFRHPARRTGASSIDDGDIKYGLVSRGDAYLVTATDTETRVWSIAPASLQRALRRAVRTCLPMVDRMSAMGQIEKQAKADYERCASATAPP
jgi:WD40 repeat protein